MINVHDSHVWPNRGEELQNLSSRHWDRLYIDEYLALMTRKLRKCWYKCSDEIIFASFGKIGPKWSCWDKFPCSKSHLAKTFYSSLVKYFPEYYFLTLIVFNDARATFILSSDTVNIGQFSAHKKFPAIKYLLRSPHQWRKCTLLSAWMRFCWEIEFLRWDISKKKQRRVLQPDWTLKKNIFRSLESRWAAHGLWESKKQWFFPQHLAYCHNVTKYSKWWMSNERLSELSERLW